MRVTVKWRETATRTSAITVDPDLGHHRIHALVDAHVRTLAKAAGAECVEAISWETDEPAARFGGRF